MAITSYAKLKEAIARWLKRNNLTDAIPDFIALAEAGLNRKLQIHHMRRSVIIVPTTPYVDLPSDYNRMIRVEYGPLKLEFIPESSARRTIKSTQQAPYSYPNDPGMMNGYTIIGDQLWLCTYIDTKTPLHFDYYGKLEPLSDENASNWLLQEAPDVYLWGALCQAEPYLKNDERLLLWKSQLQEALDELKQHHESASFGSGPLEIKAG
jgi:hypothetical protein